MESGQICWSGYCKPVVPAGHLAGPGASVSKGLAQCKFGATPYAVPVTHLVALRPEKTALSLSTRICSSKEMATSAHT